MRKDPCQPIDEIKFMNPVTCKKLDLSGVN